MEFKKYVKYENVLINEVILSCKCTTKICFCCKKTMGIMKTSKKNVT